MTKDASAEQSQTTAFATSSGVPTRPSGCIAVTRAVIAGSWKNARCATGGEQERQMLVVMHQVKVGMKVELAVGDLNAEHRQITSEVKAIKLGG